MKKLTVEQEIYELLVSTAERMREIGGRIDDDVVMAKLRKLQRRIDAAGV